MDSNMLIMKETSAVDVSFFYEMNIFVTCRRGVA